MATQIDRHNIDDSLYVFLQDNSKKWYARFQLFGKWYCKSTKQTDKNEAIAAARLLRMEWKIKADSAGAGLIAAIVAVYLTGGAALHAAIGAFTASLESCLSDEFHIKIEDKTRWIKWCT